MSPLHALRRGSRAPGSALRLEAQTNITLTRGAEDYDQADRYVVNQDSTGNFHVILDTPMSEVDMSAHRRRCVCALRQRTHAPEDSARHRLRGAD